MGNKIEVSVLSDKKRYNKYPLREDDLLTDPVR